MPASAHRPRVVILGASNVTRGISTVVGTARLLLGAPLDIYLAAGLGRSYGGASRVMGRTLPGIVDCGIWDALAASAPAPTYALVTDIGNDVIYGHDVPEIARWVEHSLQRLAPLEPRLVMTRLPLASLDSLGPLRFRVARTLLFPGRRLTLADALRKAAELNGAVEDLGARYGAQLVDPSGQWYGLDPVHVSMRHWGTCWSCILGSWTDGDASAAPRPSPRRWLTLRSAPAQQWSLFGHPLGRPQPARELPDGTRVWLY